MKIIYSLIFIISIITQSHSNTNIENNTSIAFTQAIELEKYKLDIERNRLLMEISLTLDKILNNTEKD